MKPSSLAALVVSFLGAVIAVLWWFAPPTAEARFGAVIHEVRSPFSLIRVREQGTVRSLLFVDEANIERCQSSIDLAAPATLKLAYSRGIFLSLLVRHPQDRALIIGLGGGGMVRFLNHHLPATTVEAVEIDPEVVKIALSHFGLKEGPKTRFHTADAFDFIPTSTGSFDSIYFDAFLRAPEASGLGEKTRRLKTRAFLTQVRDRIAPGGVVAFNIIPADPETEEDLASIREVFPGMARFAVPNSGNQVIIAQRSGAMPDQASLTARAAELDAQLGLGFSLADLLRERIE